MAEEGAAHRNEAAVSLHEINRSLSLRPRRYWSGTSPSPAMAVGRLHPRSP